MTFLFRKRRYYTLIELLVVIAIIAVLISILLPAVTAVRRAALKAVSMSNLRQIAIAVTDYDAHTQKPLPLGDPSYDPPSYAPGPQVTKITNLEPGKLANGVVDGGLFYVILPYLENDTLYDATYVTAREFNFSTFTSSTIKYHTATIGHGDIKVYEGPADPTWVPNAGLISYVANKQLFCANPQYHQAMDPNTGLPVYVFNFNSGYQPVTMITYSRYQLGSIPDGTTNTVMLAEAYAGGDRAVSSPGYGACQSTYSKGYVNPNKGVQFHEVVESSTTPPTRVYSYSYPPSSEVRETYLRDCRWTLGAFSILHNYGYSYSDIVKPAGKYTSTYGPYPTFSGKYQNETVYHHSYIGSGLQLGTKRVGPVFDVVPTTPPFQTYPVSPVNFYTQVGVSGGSYHLVKLSYSFGRYSYWSGQGPYTYTGSHSYNCSAQMPQANFAGGLIVSMADASVHTVSNGVSLKTWKAAMSPAGNDVPGSDW